MSNFSFLRGASHPEELCRRAARLGYPMVGLTDIHSLSGVVRAHVAAKEHGIRLLTGVTVPLRAASDEPVPEELPASLLLYPHNRAAYGRMSTLLTRGKLRAPKAECFLFLEDVLEFSRELDCLVVLSDLKWPGIPGILARLKEAFSGRTPCLSLTFHRLFLPGESKIHKRLFELSKDFSIPLVATNAVLYHSPKRRILQDIVTCIRLGCRIDEAGFHLQSNAERYLKSPREMKRLFRKWPSLLRRSEEIAERASGFSLDELRYEYPNEICPEGKSPEDYLREETFLRAEERYPEGVPLSVRKQLDQELKLIAELRYEKYFLTVYDIVKFAREREILCQGRGAAANSAVCYVLGITAVDPTQVRLLMGRFISKERNEPPDIDIDFEHERREEVIQYLYEKYGRLRAALVAEVICYRTRSAFRDVGKVFGLSAEQIDNIIIAYKRFRDRDVTPDHLRELNVSLEEKTVRYTISAVKVLKGFPRHLSQHVGGFVLSDIPLCEIVPIENAAMKDRTVLEWDKDDVDAMGMLKIDILALGMLTAIRKGIDLINQISLPLCLCGSSNCPKPSCCDAAFSNSDELQRHRGTEYLQLHTIPKEDPAVYDMMCRAETMGVFQIESRAQMSMLPRLRPRCYYDLVIEVAIVRPGPIQGGMVHPFLRRRMGLEPVTFPNEAVRTVLKDTMGVPIFQEQVMELSIVAAGFTPGEADSLRRAMASWKRNKNVMEKFRDRIRAGMLERGYAEEFAEQLFEQIRGFGEYGFPQSHSASFALLVYASSWMKHHYPDCFAAALVNSQPMGFYQPAQLIQDAKNNGVSILPIDVNKSEWDCSLEPPAQNNTASSGKRARWNLRLGMRLVRGLSKEQVKMLVESRTRSGPFTTITQLWRRSGLKVSQIRALARADAFGSLHYSRQQALWETGKLRDERLPLFEALENKSEESLQFLPELGERLKVWKDYRAMGLTLRAHPVSFYRKSLRSKQIQTIAEFKEQAQRRSGSWVAVAGLVLMRQRPATANGTIFMTLEDETGMGNLIIRRNVQERYAAAIFDGMFVIARGRTQHGDSVIHLLLEEMYEFGEKGAEISAESRDFR